MGRERGQVPAANKAPALLEPPKSIRIALWTAQLEVRLEI